MVCQTSREMDDRQARSEQFPPKWSFGGADAGEHDRAVWLTAHLDTLAVHFGMLNRDEGVFLQKNSECPRSRPGRPVPPLEAAVGLYYAEKRGIEAVFILRQVKVQPQSRLVELQPEQLAC